MTILSAHATKADPQQPSAARDGEPRLRQPVVRRRFGVAFIGALWLGGSSLSLAACSGPSAWGDPGKKGKGSEEPERVAPVAAVVVEVGAIDARVVAASTIEAERKVTVNAESTGRITKLLVEEGDFVKEGQVMATMRRDSQANQVDRASATLEKAQADYDRLAALHAKGVASDEELANARSALRTASIDRRDRGRDLANTRAIAPFSGTVTERFVTQGGWVNTGTQLVTITDFESLVARVYVPERELDRIAIGQKASILGKAAQGREGVGTVLRIAPVVDAASGTVKVTVALDADAVASHQSATGGTAGSARGFMPGMYAEVTMVTDRKEGVVLVPKAALVREDDQLFVFVVDETSASPAAPADASAGTGGAADGATAAVAAATAHKRKVKLGLQDDLRAEVIEGLSAGEQVIVAGQNGLKDGAKVQLTTLTGEQIDAAVTAAGGASTPR